MAVVVGRVVVLVGIVAALLAMSSTTMAQDDVLGLYQPRDPCPRVESIVKDMVAKEFSKNKDIVGGFLRVFFHDCFSGGCDASIFLEREWRAFPVQDRVRDFVNEIRVEVNRQCGDKAVSCADILALATRDAVAEAKGPRVPVTRGRFDSRQPGDVSKIPSPGQSIPDLQRLFAGFKLDAADLVALSGGHTVGKTRNACGVVNPAFRASCNPARGQDLDVITPVVFDNAYYVGLNRSLGMFNTDQDLVSDRNPTTKALAQTFARDQAAFFSQWGISFKKLSDINWVRPNNGEIRRHCSRTNTGGRLDLEEELGLGLRSVVQDQ